MCPVIRLRPMHNACNTDLKNVVIYLTPNFEVLLQGTCVKCRRTIQIFMPLEELARDCSTLTQPTEFSIRDIADLKALHITLPPEQKLLNP